MGSISKRRQERKNRISMIWVSLIVVALVSVFSVRSAALYTEAREYEQKQENLEKQLQKEEERAKDLAEEEKYRQTKKYVEDYAHDQLGLVYPGEIIFKPAE